MSYEIYEIDTVRDKFIRRTTIEWASCHVPSKKINVKDYNIWLDYYYNHQSELSRSFAFDEAWYEARKAVALRLEKALETSSAPEQDTST